MYSVLILRISLVKMRIGIILGQNLKERNARQGLDNFYQANYI